MLLFIPQMQRTQFALVLISAAVFTIQCGQKLGKTTNGDSSLQSDQSTPTSSATVNHSPTPTSVGSAQGSNGNGSNQVTTASTNGGTPANSSTTYVSNQNLSMPPNCIGGTAYACNVEILLVKYTNATRAKYGLAPLVQDFQMSFVARDWSIKQGSTISHAGFPEARVAAYQTKFGSTPASPPAAENVASMSSVASADSEAKQFADMWEHSSDHLANIIGNYSTIGVGIACTSSSGCVGTQIFMP